MKKNTVQSHFMTQKEEQEYIQNFECISAEIDGLCFNCGNCEVGIQNAFEDSHHLKEIFEGF